MRRRVATVLSHPVLITMEPREQKASHSRTSAKSRCVKHSKHLKATDKTARANGKTQKWQLHSVLGSSIPHILRRPSSVGGGRYIMLCLPGIRNSSSAQPFAKILPKGLCYAPKARVVPVVFKPLLRSSQKTLRQQTVCCRCTLRMRTTFCHPRNDRGSNRQAR